MGRKISVIIPNHNGARTIGTCIEALQRSAYDEFEVIVVDDLSSDESCDITGRYPCRLIRLPEHRGASVARNTGAAAATGEILFFIDADCVVSENTLGMVESAFERHPGCVIGGSYAPLAYDDTFFSTFQSIFINYSELRKQEPDYIAAHAMVISRELFMKSGGFPEDFMPIIEDVEFSHRLKRSGIRLVMDSSILVRHIFNFDLERSLRNAFRKSKYWTGYSLSNRDLFSDSGTASVELKFGVLSAPLIWLFIIFSVLHPERMFVLGAIVILSLSLFVSRRLVEAFYGNKGAVFAVLASIYYSLIYPFAVASGGASGILLHLRKQA